jgi:hypothetical protein
MADLMLEIEYVKPETRQFHILAPACFKFPMNAKFSSPCSGSETLDFAKRGSFCRRADLRLLLPVIRHEGQGPRETKPHTLGISVAQVAFVDPTAVAVEADRTERTNRHAHAAADAAIVVDHDPLQRVVPVHGVPGTDFQTGRRLTVLAAHRQMETFSPVPQDAYPGVLRIDHTFLGQGAGNLAQSASGASMRVDDKGLAGHQNGILKLYFPG